METKRIYVHLQNKYKIMEHEVVSYKQAIVLDKIGYDTIHWFGNAASLYDIMGYHTMYVNYGIMLSGINDGYISAPLKQQVFRWFREKYNILHAVVAPIKITASNKEGYRYSWEIIDEQEEWFVDESLLGYLTYEEAENACIDKLIELVKQQQL